MKAINVVLATVLVALPAAGFAQTTKHERHHINARKENQQDRVAQGVKSGQLTAGETAKLEHQETGINQEERGMRAEDNGHLTAQDRHTLARSRTRSRAESIATSTTEAVQ